MYLVVNNNTPQRKLKSIGCSNICIDKDTLSNIPLSVPEHQILLPKQDQDNSISLQCNLVYPDTLGWSQYIPKQVAKNISQYLDYPDSFEWSQEVRIIEVAL